MFISTYPFFFFSALFSLFFSLIFIGREESRPCICISKTSLPNYLRVNKYFSTRK